jgi:hypothetical protein
MRRYGYGLGLFVLGFAASYVLIYLYRWEWNRALMSAVLLLVAEVALVGAATLDRLRRVEAKVDSIGPESRPADPASTEKPSAVIPSAGIAGGSGRVVQAPATGNLNGTDLPRQSNRPILFPWLRDPDEPVDRFGVFIPILMGAGILLSGLAWLVERLARVVNRTVLEGSPADRPNYLTLPPGGPFAAAELPADDPVADTKVVDRRLPAHQRIAVAVGALVIVGPGVLLLADLTQSRPDPDMPADASIVTIDVSSNTSGFATLSVRAQRQWELCGDTSNLELRASTLLQVDSTRFVGVVTPALGEQAERRFRGCLTDLTIDFVQLRIVSIEDVDEQPVSAMTQHRQNAKL